MIKWLERQEKVAAFKRLLEVARERDRANKLKMDEAELEAFDNALVEEKTKKLIEEESRRIIIVQQPMVQQLSFIASAHGCSKLDTSLSLFLTRTSKMSCSQARNFTLPFNTLHVYSQFKLVNSDDEEHVYTTIKASLAQQDTVVVMQQNTAQSTGLQGKLFSRHTFS